METCNRGEQQVKCPSDVINEILWLSKNSEQIDQYIQYRKQELTSCRQTVIIKSESIGKAFDGFFTEEHIIYPGRNDRGFRLNDDEMYKGLICATQLIADSGRQYDDKCQQAFDAVVYAVQEYSGVLFPEGYDFRSDEFELHQKKRSGISKFRQDFFNETGADGVVDISDIRLGIMCTERSAIAHNMLAFLGVYSRYCNVGFEKYDNGKLARTPSAKHSIVVAEDQSGVPVIFDPAAASCDFRDGKPFIKPQTKQIDLTIGQQGEYFHAIGWKEDVSEDNFFREMTSLYSLTSEQVAPWLPGDMNSFS